MNLTFAEITEADVPELTSVMTRAFDDDSQKHLGIEKGGPPGYDNGGFFREWLFGYSQTAGYKASFEGRIVGGAIVWIFETGNNILGTIFVDPESQGRGVGAHLWEFIETTHPDTKTWELETPSFSTKTHVFYERSGFRKVDVRPAEGDMPGETWIYRKEIDSDQNRNRDEP